jgi:CBS domain-containing protein
VRPIRVCADVSVRGACDDLGMNVEDMMSSEVVTVSPSTPIKEVARLLVNRRISGVPVVDDEGRVHGVVSEGDIVIKERGVAEPSGHAYHRLFGADEGEALKREARTAAEAMTCPAVTIEPARSVAEAARVMVERSVNRLPVVREGRLVGIVTRADLVRVFVRDDEELEREIRDDVVLHTLWIDPSRLRIAVSDGEVTIGGEVATRTDAELVAGYAARVPGVVSVDDSRLRWREDDLARRHWTSIARPTV